MTVTAHPFAVARNRDLDWRPLLAPAPLLDSGQDFALVLQTGEMHPAPLTLRVWRDECQNPWMLAYRSTAATSDLLAMAGKDQLTDRFGRALFIVEGVAVSGIQDLSPEAAAAMVDQVHDQAVAAFRNFWDCDDESARPQASQPLTSPPSGDQSRTWIYPAFAVIGLAILVVGITYLRRRLGG